MTQRLDYPTRHNKPPHSVTIRYRRVRACSDIRDSTSLLHSDLRRNSLQGVLQLYPDYGCFSFSLIHNFPGHRKQRVTHLLVDFTRISGGIAGVWLWFCTFLSHSVIDELLTVARLRFRLTTYTHFSPTRATAYKRWLLRQHHPSFFNMVVQEPILLFRSISIDSVNRLVTMEGRTRFTNILLVSQQRPIV